MKCSRPVRGSDAFPSVETARVHHAARGRCGLAARGARRARRRRSVIIDMQRHPASGPSLKRLDETDPTLSFRLPPGNATYSKVFGSVQLVGLYLGTFRRHVFTTVMWHRSARSLFLSQFVIAYAGEVSKATAKIGKDITPCELFFCEVGVGALRSPEASSQLSAQQPGSRANGRCVVFPC